MPLSKSFFGVRGDECQCGRRASIRHCPECGSTRTYARINRYHKYANGEVKLVENEYRCQGCGHLFVNEEREFCIAPPVGEALQAQKMRALHEAAQSGEYLTPAERVAAESLIKSMGGEVKASLSEEERNRLTNELRTAYRHHLLAFNTGEREDHPGEIEAYVENGIKMLEAEWLKASRS